MRFSLSTNWCNRRIESGREIAEMARKLGFDELELGFHTTAVQAKEIAALRDTIPVGSIHAFCPVPISAPQGYPELYLLADFDDETRKMAQIHVRRNIFFAAETGADTVVLHAGRVMCRGFLRRWDMKRRVKRGQKMLDVFKKELESLVPVLEQTKVTLALENLPYLEGFPAEWEIGELVGDRVKPWLDTGHDYVRQTKGWRNGLSVSGKDSAFPFLQPVGLHVSDSLGDDDHLAPGAGKVDFAALGDVARQARHLVFEPNPGVTEEELKKGLAFIRDLWSPRETPPDSDRQSLS